MHIYSSTILKYSFDVIYTYSIYYIEKYHLVASPNVKKCESDKSLNKLQMSWINYCVTSVRLDFAAALVIW